MRIIESIVPPYEMDYRNLRQAMLTDGKTAHEWHTHPDTYTAEQTGIGLNKLRAAMKEAGMARENVVNLVVELKSKTVRLSMAL